MSLYSTHSSPKSSFVISSLEEAEELAMSSKKPPNHHYHMGVYAPQSPPPPSNTFRVGVKVVCRDIISTENGVEELVAMVVLHQGWRRYETPAALTIQRSSSIRDKVP